MQAHEPAEAFLLHFVGDVVGIVQGAVRSFFLAVGKGAHALEACPARELQQFGESLVGLARMSHHERRAQMDAGQLVAKALDEVVGFSLRDGAPHGFEDGVGDVLQRHVEVAADVGVTLHHSQQFPREISGICVVETYPFHPFDVGHSVDEFGDGATTVKVYAVVGQLLGDDVELAHATGHQLAHLIEDVLDGPAVVATGDDGDPSDILM